MRKYEGLWIDGSGRRSVSAVWSDGKLISVTPAENTSERMMIPALIDIHTHGFRGYTSEETSEDLRKLAAGYACRGIGGFCATIGPRPFREVLLLIDEYRKAFSVPYAGARFLGLHMEGPYLNPEKAGAIDPKTMRKVDLNELETFLKLARGAVKIMTLAPEIPQADEAIRLLKKYGVLASAGHTAAGYETSEEAVRNGMTQVTHTFNAMNSLHHRQPGLICSALTNPLLDCEMISDTYHLQLPIMNLLIQAKSCDHVLCVSDSGSDSGYPYEDGTVLADGSVVQHGAMVQPDGVIAGSTKDLSDALLTLVKDLKIPLEQAVRMTSLNAARKLQLPDWGLLAPGKSVCCAVYDSQLNFIETQIDENFLLMRNGGWQA